MFVFAAILFSACKHLSAQSVSAMTGTVVDSSGAVVPGVTVTLTNRVRGLTFTQITNSSGTYRFSDIPPGDGYEATFAFNGSGGGFAPLSIKNIYLNVATVRTQNATLVVGAHTEVEVTASNSNVTINTVDASIGNNFEVKQLNNLPVQQRNDPTALFTLQPGVTDQGSTTGARTDQNNITLDGLDVNDFATGGASQTNSGVTQGFSGSIVGHAPVDSVQEFRGMVGGFPASSGPGGGGQFSLVTKGGTNQFHGNINEYHRDPSLVANSWFSNNSTPVIPRNHLIQNQFGGNIGGPVWRNKLFFFFDFNDSRIISSALAFRTVPLDSLRAGNISYINSTGGTSILTPAQVLALDPAGIGESQTFLSSTNARYPHSNAAGGDGINSGGYNFNAPDNDFATNYVGRVDWNLNANMKMFGRFTISHENSTENLNQFGGDPASNPFVDRTYAFVVGHTWVIGANKTNSFFIGETVENFAFPNTYNPAGSNWLTFGDGTQSSLTSTLYLTPASSNRRIPVPVIGDDFTWTKGSHTWQFGGTFKDILAKNNNIADFNTVIVGLGGQTLGLNSSLRPANIYVAPANATPDQTALQNTANQTYDQAFAYMLARIGSIQSDFNYNASGKVLPQLTGDQRIYRNYQTQLYFGDTWKVTRNLTLSYGLNYQIFSVPYETRGLESTETMSFDQYFSARVAQSNAAKTGANAVPLISYILGGKANNGPPLYQPQYNNLAPRFAFAYNPGFDKKTVFNGGAGLVYDRTIINAIQQIQDVDSYLFQQTESTPSGIPGDPYNSIRTDPRLDKNNGISTVPITPPATPKPPYQPFVANGVPFGLQSGSAFNETIDPALKTPYSISYNAGMQTALPGDTVLKISYVGRLGRRLLAQADANQIIDFPDTLSGQLLSQAFAAITLQNRAGVPSLSTTPQPWFEHVVAAGTGTSNGYANNTTFLADNFGGLIHNGDFGDFVQALSNFTPLNVGSAAQYSENTFFTNKGFSSYNALLMSFQKNLSHGLQFDLNYTWAHSIDNVSFFANSEGDTGIGGIGLVCDVARPRLCRSNSDFDVTNYVTADELYQLPFGKGRTFMAGSSRVTNLVIGGWDVSGITEYHSGIAWGTNSNAFVASYSNDAPGILVGNPASVATRLQKLHGGGVNIFQNQAAARGAYTGPIGFQIGARNGLRGPRFFNQDLGLAKNFPITSERLNLKFRADAFNAFNHPNFSLPQSNAYNGFDQQDVTSTTFGNISNTVTPAGNLNNGARVLQLALRLEF
jgi:hypothetical protein